MLKQSSSGCTQPRSVADASEGSQGQSLRKALNLAFCPSASAMASGVHQGEQQLIREDQASRRAMRQKSALTINDFALRRAYPTAGVQDFSLGTYFSSLRRNRSYQ